MPPSNFEQKYPENIPRKSRGTFYLQALRVYTLGIQTGGMSNVRSLNYSRELKPFENAPVSILKRSTRRFQSALLQKFPHSSFFFSRTDSRSHSFSSLVSITEDLVRTLRVNLCWRLSLSHTCLFPLSFFFFSFFLSF